MRGPSIACMVLAAMTLIVAGWVRKNIPKMVEDGLPASKYDVWQHIVLGVLMLFATGVSLYFRDPITGLMNVLAAGLNFETARELWKLRDDS